VQANRRKIPKVHHTLVYTLTGEGRQNADWSWVRLKQFEGQITKPLMELAADTNTVRLVQRVRDLLKVPFGVGV
jgi:hypothetical protein